MSLDHRKTLLEKYQYKTLVFSEACGGGVKPLPDVDDLFPPEDRHGKAAWLHIRATIDEIFEQSVLLSERLKNDSLGVA